MLTGWFLLRSGNVSEQSMLEQELKELEQPCDYLDKEESRQRER